MNRKAEPPPEPQVIELTAADSPTGHPVVIVVPNQKRAAEGLVRLAEVAETAPPTPATVTETEVTPRKRA